MHYQTLVLFLTASIPLIHASLPVLIDPVGEVARRAKEFNLSTAETAELMDRTLEESQMGRVAQAEELERLRQAKKREEAAQRKALEKLERERQKEREEQQKLLDGAKKLAAKKRTKNAMEEQNQLISALGTKTSDPTELVSIVEDQREGLDLIEGTKTKKQDFGTRKVVATGHKSTRTSPSSRKKVTQTTTGPAKDESPLRPRGTGRVQLVYIGPKTHRYPFSPDYYISLPPVPSMVPSSLYSSSSSSISSSSSSSASSTSVVSKEGTTQSFPHATRLGTFISPAFIRTHQEIQTRDYHQFMALYGREYETFLSRNWHDGAFMHTNICITREHDIDEEFLETLPQSARSLSYGHFLEAHGQAYYDHIFKETQEVSTLKTLEKDKSTSIS